MPAAIVGAVIAGAVSGGVAALGGAAFGAAFLQAFATNLVLGVVSKAFADSPDSSQGASLAYDSNARMQTVRQPIQYHRVIVGTDRVGGALTWAVSSTNVVGLVATFAAHRTRAIRLVYFADEVVPFENNGSTGRLAGYIAGYPSLGTEGSAQPFPNARETFPAQWTANHLQQGRTKMFFRIWRDRNVFPNGIPNITALIDGYDQVYDPRTASNVFSSNPALWVACYLTTAAFNKDAVDWSAIDEDALIAAANVCDERVSQVYQPAFTVSAATDTLTFSADETQIKTGDSVKYHTTGSVAGGLANDTIYYAIMTGAATAKLATTRDRALGGVAIDLTSAGTGTQTLERMPVFTADHTTDVLTFAVAERRLQRGDGVRLETSGALPTGLSAATTYYWIPLTDTRGQLATSYANAFAGTAVTFTSNGTGTHRLQPYDEVRYAVNGSFTLDTPPQQIIDELKLAMAGSVVKAGGVWVIAAGAYTAPAITLTDDDMDGARQIQVMPGRDANANGVRGVFVGPENDYQPTDMVPVTNDTYLTVDNDERVWRDVEYKMIRRHSQGRRLEKIELETIRQGLTLTLACKVSAYRVMPGEVIGVTVARYGWSNKAFQVINTKLVIRGGEDNRRFGVDLLVRETASGIYDWAATENSAADIAPNTALADAFERMRAVPLNVSGLQLRGQGNDTVFSGRDAKFTWRENSAYYAWEFGSEPAGEGLGAGRRDDHFAGWVVKVYKTDGTQLGPAEGRLVQDPAFDYTYEKNYEDTGGVPVREFTVKVWAKTKFGQVSAVAAQLTVSNAAPTAGAPSVSASVKGLVFTFPKALEPDFNGYKLWGSTTNGFTADDSTLLYSGFDTEKVVGNLTTGVTFYYKYCATDTFGDGTVSAQQSASPGVLTLTADLAANSATKINSSVAGAVDTLNYLTAASYESIVFNYLAIDIDTANPADLMAQFTATLKASASSNNAVNVDLRYFYAKGRYTTGSITSLSQSGGLARVNGSGTAWLSSGVATGDILILGNGYPILTVDSVISDTQLSVDFDGSGSWPLHAYAGSYQILKEATSSGTIVTVDVLAGLIVSVGAHLTVTTPDELAYTHSMLAALISPDFSLGTPFSATISVSAQSSVLDAFKSIR